MGRVKEFKKSAIPNLPPAAAPEVKSLATSVSQLQERLQEYLVPFNANPLVDGVLLSNIALSTAPKQIEHKLRRAPLGWLVVRTNAAESVHESSTELSTAYLTLTASGPVTVSLWVF